jgi:hypothetical protein
MAKKIKVEITVIHFSYKVMAKFELTKFEKTTNYDFFRLVFEVNFVFII